MSAPGYVDIVLDMGERIDFKLNAPPVVRLRADRFAPERVETREQLAALTTPGIVLRSEDNGDVIELVETDFGDQLQWIRGGWAAHTWSIELPAIVLYRPDSGERPSGAGDPVLPRGEILTEEPAGQAVVRLNDNTEWMHHLTSIFDGWIRPTFDTIHLRSWDWLATKEPRLISTPTTDAEEAAR